MNTIAGYLFVTFCGESPLGEQIYFSCSRDGFHWFDLNGGKPVLTSGIGEKGVRDPFILRSWEGDRYYLIATDLRIASGKGWEAALKQGSSSVIIWESEDLIHWSEERACEIAPEGAGCVWAPEAIYDKEKNAYMVFWSSYVKGKTSIYRSYTSDFRTFTEAELYLEKEYDVIDMTILQDGEFIYRIYKDEINKNLCMDRAKNLNDEFQMVETAGLSDLHGVEGPAAFPLQDGRWCVLADQYAINGGYMPLICGNPAQEPFVKVASDAYHMGEMCKRHGSVLELTQQEEERLQNYFAEDMKTNPVSITDPFWKKKVELVRDVVLPYQWNALNDQIPDAQPSYCMHNFRVAAKLTQQAEQKADYVAPTHTVNGFCIWPEDPKQLEDRFYGFVFQDSDFAKWIEAAAYILRQYPDEELEKRADDAIDLVCSAQQPDGYLDTFYSINDISKRFTNLRNNHELYCLGHLIEGAVAYYQTTGKDKLLQAACRFADCVDQHIGPEEGKLHGYPGHEIAEMALAKLYHVTGEERYKKLGEYFINERGKKPYFFDFEDTINDSIHEDTRYQYQQANLPVREQPEAVGHAVRAVYLYSGMADFARLTLDASLKQACKRLWNDITDNKMYITGGIGGTHIGEAFSYSYDLPNDTAYSETCASIGMIFFAKRMLELEQDSRYADVMEREFYNVVLAGMGLEGDTFFYVNPLEVVPEACHKDKRKEHVEPVRKKWFGCACCPPNLARLLGSLGDYIFTWKKDALFVNLYIQSKNTITLASGEINVEIQSTMPWEGLAAVHVTSTAKESFTLALRIPDWVEEWKVQGVNDAETEIKNGYFYITKVWGEEELQLEFPMEIRILEAHEKVREDIGKAAVMRGPLVYCLEEVDNGADLHLIRMDAQAEFHVEEKMIASENVLAIKGTGLRQKKKGYSGLYSSYKKKEYEEAELCWIPYYAWANRGEGEMQVWTRVEI